MYLALSYRRSLCGAFIVAAACCSLACGEIESPSSSGQGGRAGSAMGTGAAGSSGSSSGSGGMSMGGTGNAEQDAGPETGAGNGEFMYPAGCPEPMAIAAPDAVTPQRVVIQSVNFDTSEIVIRNISSRPIDIEGGQMGWQWCNIPGYDLLVLETVTLEPDATLAFYLIQNGMALRPLYDGDDAGDPNEMAIYTTTGSFMSSELMTSFASWGAGHTGGRESVAVTAGVWAFGERIEIGAGHSGFIITGRADLGSGYTSVPARCLVHPPNPPGTRLPMVGGTSAG